MQSPTDARVAAFSLLVVIVTTLLIVPLDRVGAQQGAAVLKSSNFDTDPDWDGFNNRMKPDKVTVIKQDFGYSATNHAGKKAGELGGTIQRSMMPAFYAKQIQPKTLKDRLTATGSFAITNPGGSGGVFFGFFNDKKTGSSGRPTNSLGLCFDFQGSGGRLAVYLITASNQCHGNFVTPYIPGTYRPTPIKGDGSVRYTFKLDYDPTANSGNGQFVFTIKGDGKTPANFEGRKLVVDIPKELRTDDTTFTHFGMLNLLVDGGATTLWFDDLKFNDESEDFTTDPGWVGSSNRGEFAEKEPHGYQNFGFTETNIAGGKSGEIGGILWRNQKGGYYADRVGKLSLEDRIEARGRVNLVVAGTDADMKIGFFKSSENNNDPKPNTAFLGVGVGGPTRVGHYFLPVVTNSQGRTARAEGTKENPKAGPIMVQKRATDWTLVYDPQANNGNGAVTVTLTGEKVVLNLPPGMKSEGATFDRFGLLAIPEGGHHVKIYLDDLQYTTKPE